MVNPGSFKGARKAFLLSQKLEYALAVKEHRSTETLSLILRAFFKRFPIHLPDDYEPSEAELALIDDNAPDPELPDVDSAEESDTSADDASQPQPKKKKKKKAKQSSRSRKNRIAFRREQIKRWMSYQYAKDNSEKEKENGAFNPYKIFLPRFVRGLKTPEPRRRPALNIWRQTKRSEINEILNTQVEAAKNSENPILPSHFATRREAIARSLFLSLSPEERDHWETVADEKHELAKAQHKLEQEQEISTSPADRQRAIQMLSSFIKPILALICDVTGWKCTFIAGGPEPAANGQFSVISVHSGETKGPIPLNFGCVERAVYKKQLVPAFARFLRLCYSPDECRSSALDPQEGFMPMSEIAEDDPSSSMIVHEVEKSPSPMVSDTIEPPSAKDLTTSENDNMRGEEDGASSSTTVHGLELPSANGQATEVVDGGEEGSRNEPPSANSQATEVVDGGEEGSHNPFPFEAQSPFTSPSPSPASSPILPRDHNIDPALDVGPLALTHLDPPRPTGPCSTPTAPAPSPASSPILPRDHNIDPALDVAPVASANGRGPPSTPHLPHPLTAAPGPRPSPQPAPPTAVASNPTTAVGPLKIFLPPRATSSKNQKSSKKRKRAAPVETSAVGPKQPSQPSTSKGPSENSETSTEPQKRCRIKSAKALAMEGS